MEKRLIEQDTEAIQNFEFDLRSKVEQTLNILNAIQSNYKFESPDTLPADSDKFILKLYCTRNKEAQRRLEYEKGFGLDMIILPKDLNDLLYSLRQWQRHEYKTHSGYLIKADDKYLINEEMVRHEMKRFADSKTEFAETPDQQLRYDWGLQALEMVKHIAEIEGVDFSSDSYKSKLVRDSIKIPALIFKNYPYNNFFLNTFWIKTGRINK